MTIKNAYNIWAKIYDSNDNPTRDLELQAGEDMLSGHHSNNVLELGCGTGKNTEWLINQSHKILAMDFSEEMLNKAKEKIVSENVHFRQADINKLWDAKSASFDLIRLSETILVARQTGTFIFPLSSPVIRANPLPGLPP